MITLSLSSYPRLRPKRAFTLIEMMITLVVFIMLAGAVFGILTGVLESTSTLQDNQARRDEVSSLNAFIKKELGELPAGGTVDSYKRGDGEGLVQNGIVFGTTSIAKAIDAKVQPNGYYILRLTSYTATPVQGQTLDARPILEQAIESDDQTIPWTTLITDIKTLDWKFMDPNGTDWVDTWTGSTNPNLVEFSLQPAGDLVPATMDFWLPKIDAIVLNIAPTTNAAP
jgi:hypothetical protein